MKPPSTVRRWKPCHANVTPEAWRSGCSIGVLTERLAARCDQLLAIDVAEAALATARQRLGHLPHVTLRRMEVPRELPTGTFDLLLLSEVLYYFDRDDLQALARFVERAVEPGGTILLAHWLHDAPYPLTGDEAVELFLARLAPFTPDRYRPHGRPIIGWTLWSVRLRRPRKRTDEIARFPRFLRQGRKRDGLSLSRQISDAVDPGATPSYRGCHRFDPVALRIVAAIRPAPKGTGHPELHPTVKPTRGDHPHLRAMPHPPANGANGRHRGAVLPIR